MINILLSAYDFGESKLYISLRKYIRKDMKVVIIPFSFSKFKIPTVIEYNSLCEKGGKYFELISDQFQNFGISYENINIIHYYNDKIDVMKEKIKNSDIIFFTGGLPDKSVERLIEKDLLESIKTFSGIIMGSSAGALIQLTEYFCTPDEDYSEFSIFKGLGLIKQNISIEVHYKGKNLIQEFPELVKSNKIIYAIPDGSGLIFQENKIEISGNVKVFNRKKH